VSHLTETHQIDDFIARVEKALLHSTPTPVNYVDRVDLANNTLPDTLAGKQFNLYAIWVRECGSSEWSLRYIGERSTRKSTGEGCKRLQEHLFKKPHERTGSQLEKVREAIARGAELAVTTVLAAPESMRLAAEEELIGRSFAQGHLLWNTHGRPARSKAPRAEPVPA